MYLHAGQMPAPNGSGTPQSGQLSQPVSGLTSTGSGAGGGCRGGAMSPDDTSARQKAARKARASSPAELKRSSGSLVSARATTSPTAGGRSGRASRIDGGA